ncbi:DHA2 family efflux MFS transporter permease subunit [Nakamurella leprariae]|uniref:DHA2 family efflux MFS transporter permease subunit n=1 Tax=Nakamurella leprariae TaxID=2803911 RepID=A0A939C030_9ACTN|nr:DHA2 family efflux MFS transporter permease subunit [Nakamurella leprariae]MBM9468805.1 DHA2 family efflux MFS transporter permease subunit [Nakamurella leprariae]
MTTSLEPADPPAPARGGAGPSRRFVVPVWMAVLAASVPMFMATLDNLVVTSALPVIHLDLGAQVEDLQWITNAYTLSFASLMLLAVTLGDRFGRRRLFVAGIVLFTAASAWCALAADPGTLIAARAVQGAGAAMIMPLSLTLLAESVPPRLRALAIGIWGGVSGLGVALGPLIGGAVVEGWSWQAIFWINVPIGVLGAVLAAGALPNTFGERVRADLLGVLLAGVGVLGLVYGIVRGNEAGWTSAEVLVALIGGMVLLGAFLRRQTRTDAPVLPLRLFRNRGFSVVNVVGLAFSFGAFGAVFILIQFLQVVQGRSPLEAGVMTMPWTMAPMVVAPLAGLLAPRVGTRALIVGGTALLAAGIGWIGITLTPDQTFVSMLPGFVMAGVGMGLIFAPASTVVLAGLPTVDHAKASGTNSMLREVGVALGIAVLTAVFTGAGGELTPTGYVDAARPAVLVGAAAVALAMLVGLLLPAGRGTGEPSDEGTTGAVTDRAERIPA